MPATVSIKLFATLRKRAPADADRYPIAPGTTVDRLVAQLGIPAGEAKLIFIDGVKADATTVLQGGERIGIFPPVGGG